MNVSATLLAAALVAVCVSGPGSAAGQAQQRRQPPARREATVPFRAGETLTYDVSWSSYLVAGTAMTTVHGTQPSGGSDAYYIVAEGRPIPILARLYNLSYKMDTLLDTATLLS